MIEREIRRQSHYGLSGYTQKDKTVVRIEKLQPEIEMGYIPGSLSSDEDPARMDPNINLTPSIVVAPHEEVLPRNQQEIRTRKRQRNESRRRDKSRNFRLQQPGMNRQRYNGRNR